MKKSFESTRNGGRPLNSERGAMLVHGALIFLALLAITTFVVDMGIMWVGRRSAQNAADAGALAGVTAMAFDNATDHTTTGPAVQSAYLIATSHAVWGQAPNVDINTDITFPLCPDGTNNCIRVDVYRNQARGNPLPIIFGQIVGLSAQGTRATATGQVKIGNASNCLKPWVVPDAWNDKNGDGIYENWVKNGNTLTAMGPDVYTPPTPSSPGTGYQLPRDYGMQFTIKAGSPSTSITPGWFSPIDLPLPPAGATITGGSQYRTNISTCSGWPVSIGDSSMTNPPTVMVENGNMIGPTKQGVQNLIAEDPGAYWDSTSKTVKGSCAPQCASISPRIVSIALVDTDILNKSIVSSGGKNLDLKIVNIMGFFINNMSAGSNDITGVMMNYPGVITSSTPPIGPSSSFIKTPVLIR